MWNAARTKTIVDGAGLPRFCESRDLTASRSSFILSSLLSYASSSCILSAWAAKLGSSMASLWGSADSSSCSSSLFRASQLFLLQLLYADKTEPPKAFRTPGCASPISPVADDSPRLLQHERILVQVAIASEQAKNELLVFSSGTRHSEPLQGLCLFRKTSLFNGP